jgi:methyl-accepting chemotaxis protein
MTVDFEKIGRFDRSFIVAMIRDFFLVLLAVVILELGLRFMLLYYDFEHEQRQATEEAAEHLAADVRDIMRNRGGPVAASTFYPIMKRQQLNLGLEIAIEPSAKTVESIEGMFDFTPRGIPARWSQGTHHAFSLAIRAEPFCLTCHTTARAGDVLGTVTIRNYFQHHLDGWWREVKLTSLLGLAKILVHTLILFFLLRIRMEPLLSLRSTVAALSRSGFDLSKRAKLRSEDEFAELAQDLNAFLDRICHILEDMDNVLVKLTELDKRLSQTRRRMSEKFNIICASLSALTASMFSADHQNQSLDARWGQSLALIGENLAEVDQDQPLSGQLAGNLKQILDHLPSAIEHTENFRRQFQNTGEKLALLNNDLGDFNSYMAEIGLIEEKMLSVAGLGHTLLDRLAGKELKASEEA